MPAKTNPEGERLGEADADRQDWRKWGPYVSEREFHDQMLDSMDIERER